MTPDSCTPALLAHAHIFTLRLLSLLHQAIGEDLIAVALIGPALQVPRHLYLRSVSTT